MLIEIILSVILLAALSILTWQYARIKSLKAHLFELQTRYQVNPSYDCQMAMADLMGGQGLFKIERVDREDLYLRRR